GVAKRGAARELRIHLQRPDGSFAPEPDRLVALKSDIVAFAIADVRAEPGAELLFFTASSCFSYSTAVEGFAGDARKLFSWDLPLDLPDPAELVRVDAKAAASGGAPLLVLPGHSASFPGGPGGYGVFGASGGEPGAIGLLARVPGDVEAHRAAKSRQ